MKELREEIAALKISIKRRENELGEDIRHLPQQLVKSATESILPSFLNKLLANGTWKLLLSAATMFINPFSGKKGFKKSIISSAKKMGLLALVKGIYMAWSNKRKSNVNRPLDVSTPHTSSSKTKDTKKR
ncbi:MAG: hypothetical protein JST21_03285 [Bacteroidetes bacterium]|nr:hypothetical protein [Bacteroidota bacterium]